MMAICSTHQKILFIALTLIVSLPLRHPYFACAYRLPAMQRNLTSQFPPIQSHHPYFASVPATWCALNATVCHLWFSSLERGNAKGDSRYVVLCFKSRFIFSPNACQTVPANPNVSLKPRWHQRSCGVNGMSIAFNIHRKAMPVGAEVLASIYEAMDCYIK